MRTIDQMLTDINARIATNLSYSNVVYWNEAILQPKDDRTFPIVNQGDKTGRQISIKDFSLQTYHRIIDSETETNNNLGKGRFPYRKRIYTLRNVWIGDLSSISSQTYEFNDDVKNDVYAAFPTILTDKEIVITVNENVNKLDVLNEEFAGYDFSNLSMQVIAFYIEYQIHQKIRCA